MRRISLLVFRLTLFGIGIVAVSASAQRIRLHPPDPGSDPEPSRCLTDSTIQIQADPSHIDYGQSGVVRWSVSLPNGCASVRVRLNGEAVPRNGSRSVTPAGTSTYRLQISQMRSSGFIQRTAEAGIAVKLPDRVTIDASTRDPIKLLVSALDQHRKIELCNVDLDLTGYSLEVGDNTTVTAAPGCARGPRNLGPRIFVTDKRGGNGSLFVLRGDHIEFSGFRLEGPTSYIGGTEDNLERGIKISPFSCTPPECVGEGCCQPTPIEKIEISNMEISQWSGAGIEVTDNAHDAERGRLFNTREGVQIHDNYFHHNRHYDGYGYGVAVTNGAYALIEHNVFDQNRHGIMGGSSDGGKDYSGYRARENLILAGGGLHCAGSPPSYYSACWQTHQIDMHGSKSKLFLGAGCCGIAGETILIERNTVLYDAGYAIKIRGNPGDKAVADGNVFRHSNRSEAIAQNGDPGLGGLWGDNITNPIDVRANNQYNGKPMDVLGSCDFVGDRQQDKFLATGVTWWALSPTTHQWRYLNAMPETLSRLQLRDFDNDGRCDVGLGAASPVMPPSKFSKDGTRPWAPVGGGVVHGSNSPLPLEVERVRKPKSRRRPG